MEIVNATVKPSVHRVKRPSANAALVQAKGLGESQKIIDVAEAGRVETCTVADLFLLTGRKFGTVYADPPWLYRNQGTRAATGNHYASMDEICALPVRDVAADDAHLHLWTTNGFLFEAHRVMEAWGFECQGCFVWVKSQMGLGNYWRVSHEFMLFGPVATLHSETSTS